MIFLLLSVGPASFTSLRLKLSPDASRKNVIIATTPIWPSMPSSPSVPLHRWSLMLNLGFSICTRCTPRVVGAARVDSSAACSIWVAAFCTVSSALSALPGALRTESRSFCAAAGSNSTSLLASSLSE